MHTLLFLALAACSGASNQPDAVEVEVGTSRAVTPTVDRTRATISVADLKAKLDGAETVRLVDVRLPKELGDGVIPQSVMMPLGEYTPTAPPVSTTPRDVPIYFVDSFGSAKDGRARRGAEITTAAGFTAVEVDGGVEAWVAAGYELETLHGKEAPQ